VVSEKCLSLYGIKSSSNEVTSTEMKLKLLISLEVNEEACKFHSRHRRHEKHIDLTFVIQNHKRARSEDNDCVLVSLTYSFYKLTIYK